MNDDALANVDAKIASLEEAILKCEVQLQKAKRQCEASAAVDVQHTSLSQVCGPVHAPRIHLLTFLPDSVV
jgi:hypothetical protein